jgi:hypothetical protein
MMHPKLFLFTCLLFTLAKNGGSIPGDGGGPSNLYVSDAMYFIAFHMNVHTHTN